jgi:hypothetical protein
MRVVDRRMARRLVDRGWKVSPPEPAPADPCANGCSDPAAHAEGGHDI